MTTLFRTVSQFRRVFGLSSATDLDARLEARLSSLSRDATQRLPRRRMI